jgi:hypothetical protein
LTTRVYHTCVVQRITTQYTNIYYTPGGVEFIFFRGQKQKEFCWLRFTFTAAVPVHVPAFLLKIVKICCLLFVEWVQFTSVWVCCGSCLFSNNYYSMVPEL